MRIRENVLDLLFPPKCPYCEKILDNPRVPACPKCEAGLPWLEGKAGERRIDFADGCWSPLAYDEVVRKAVHRYKFGRVRALGRPFGVVMAQCLTDHLAEGADLICWAPLSKQRFRQRGFNQAELMAREMGRWTMWSPLAPPSVSAPPCCGRAVRNRCSVLPWPGQEETGMLRKKRRKLLEKTVEKRLTTGYNTNWYFRAALIETDEK